MTVADVVEAVRAGGGPALDKRRVEIGQPIKSLGTHEVTVRVNPEVSADLTLNVVPST